MFGYEEELQEEIKALKESNAVLASRLLLCARQVELLEDRVNHLMSQLWDRVSNIEQGVVG